MNVSYPRYFVAVGASCLMAASGYHMSILTFGGWVEDYPNWFNLLTKQALSQIMIICIFWLFYLWRDMDDKYFVLIRKRMQTKRVWVHKADELQRTQSDTLELGLVA